MKNDIRLTAQIRDQAGKRSVRRMRHLGQIPGVIYGAGKEAQSIQFPTKELSNALAEEATYSRILTLSVDGHGDQKAVLNKYSVTPAAHGFCMLIFYVST